MSQNENLKNFDLISVFADFDLERFDFHEKLQYLIVKKVKFATM